MRFRVIVRNVFSNWVGYGVTAVIGFLLSPYVVHHLGQTGYGVWTLVVSLTGYFGVLDLGLRQSVGRFVVRYVSLDDAENVNRTLTSAVAMLAGGGLLALLATVVFNFAFGVFHIEPRYQLAAREALLIAGLNISLALPLSVFSSILWALERLDILNAISIFGAAARATLTVMILGAGYGLVPLALITILENTAEYLVILLLAKRLYPKLGLRLRYFSRATCKQLMGFGIFRFIWIVGNQLIFYTDSLVIGAFLNAGAITYYAIAGSLINYGRNIVSLASDPFYPSATRLDSKDDLEGMRRLQLVGTQVALLVGLPICLGFIFLGKQFITLWMGKEYAVSSLYLSVLTIPQFTSIAQYISAIVLVGMARHKILAQTTIGEGIANLLLSIVLVQRIGLIGVAWGTAIPHLITTGIVIPIYILRTLKLSLRDYFFQGWLRPLICGVAIASLFYLMAHFVERVSWVILGAEIFVPVVVFAVMAYFVCLTSEQRAFAASKIEAIFQRKVAVQQA